MLRELLGTLDVICLGIWQSLVNTILQFRTALLYFAFGSAGVYKSSKCKHEILTSDKKTYPEIRGNYSAICVHLLSCSFVTLKHMSLSLLYVLIVAIIVATLFAAQSCVQGAHRTWLCNCNTESDEQDSRKIKL